MRSKSVLGLSLTAVGVLGVAGSAAATPPQGLTTTILAKSTMPALDVRAHTRGPDAWGVQIKTRGISDGYVVDNVIAPGGTTGWHSHPAPRRIDAVAPRNCAS
jgi:hypothetical protein